MTEVVRRQPPQVRRRLLLDAARSVIAERGLPATTVRDVAAAGGVAVGTVTYHFSGMSELLAGVLEQEMSEFSAGVWAAADAAPTGRSGLLALIDGLLATDADDHWRLWLDFWALAAHRADYAQWQARVYRDLHGLTEALLRRGVADGSLAVPSPATHAVQFIALLDGLVVQAYLPHSRLTPAQAREMLVAYCDETFSPGGNE